MPSEKSTSNGPVREFVVDALTVRVYARREDLAEAAAVEGAGCLNAALGTKGSAAAILATGNSQIEFLDRLIRNGSVDWSRLTLFHMDEYLGIAADHPASFRRYLRERVAGKIHLKEFHFLKGDASEPIRECDRYGERLRDQPIDLCCLGIGDNGHLAFNDPPVADFEDTRAVKIVKLDWICRQQQAGQGHFSSPDAVPEYALTLTIPTLCAAGRVVCLAPGRHKAAIVKRTLEGAIATKCPASVLRRYGTAVLLLDADAASMLTM